MRAEGLSLSRAAESVGSTMLAPGSGPEQRNKLALQWRQVSCEYGSRTWGQGDETCYLTFLGVQGLALEAQTHGLAK